MTSRPGLHDEESVLQLDGHVHPEEEQVPGALPVEDSRLILEDDNRPSVPTLVLNNDKAPSTSMTKQMRRSASGRNDAQASSKISRLGVRAMIMHGEGDPAPPAAKQMSPLSKSPPPKVPTPSSPGAPGSHAGETVQALSDREGSEEDEPAPGPVPVPDRRSFESNADEEQGDFGPRPKMEGRTRQFAVSMFEKEGATTKRHFKLNEADPEEHRDKGYVLKWLGVLEVAPPDTDTIDDSIPVDGEGVPSYPTSRSSEGGAAPGPQPTNSGDASPSAQAPQLTPEEEARQAQFRQRDELKRKYLDEEKKRKEEEMMERMAKRMGLQTVTKKALLEIEAKTAEPSSMADAGDTDKPRPPPAELLDAEEDPDAEPWLPTSAAEVFSRAYWKKTFARIVANPNFETVVLLLIIGNCMTLALFRPTEPPHSKWNEGLNKTDIALNCAFTIELMFRFLAAPALKDYFASFWNIFDIIMVGFGWLVLLPDSASGGGQGGAVKAMRALRALRPLRTITRVESLKAIVVCFMEAIPLLSSVIGLFFILMVIFAIAAVMLFQDAYRRRCYDPINLTFEAPGPSGTDEFGCGGHRRCPAGFECINYTPGRGEYALGFDNLGSSLLMVFQMITLSNWSFIMYRTVDNTGWYVAIYYVILILFGSYFMVNMILAVLKNKFGQAQTMFENFTGATGLVKHKKRRNTLIKLLANAQGSVAAFVSRKRESGLAASIASSAKSGGSELDPEVQWYKLPLPSDANLWVKLRYWMAQIVHHKWFDIFFMSMILGNTVALAAQYYGMSAGYALVLHNINVALTALFAFEVAIKMLGMGFWEWVSDGWNWFDLIVTIISVIDIAVSSSGRLAVLRAFRVLRLFRLFKMMKSLQRIGNVLMKAMGSFASITGLIILFLFVFTVIGMHAFGDIQTSYDRNAQTWINFDSFPTALQGVFQVMTLEDWDVVMYTVADKTNAGAFAFFLVWAIIGKYILLTIFLAVTLEAFESKYDQEAIKDAVRVKSKLEKENKPRVPRLGFRFRKNKDKEEGEATVTSTMDENGSDKNNSFNVDKLSPMPSVQIVALGGAASPQASQAESERASTGCASTASIAALPLAARAPLLNAGAKPRSRLSVETRADDSVPLEKSGPSGPLVSALKPGIRLNQVYPLDARASGSVIASHVSIDNADMRRLVGDGLASSSQVESSDGKLTSREGSERTARRRGVRFAEGPVDESASEHGAGPEGRAFLVPPSVLPWGRHLTRVHPLEAQPSAYAVAPGVPLDRAKDTSSPSNTGRGFPGPVAEGIFSGLLGRGKDASRSGEGSEKRPRTPGDDDDNASVASGMSAASGASGLSGISGISGGSSNASSGQYEAMKDAMEAKYLMDDTASNTSSSIGSTKRADAEIIMGVREEKGKLSRKARLKYQLKHRFNPNAPPPYTGVSWFMFKPSNKFRQLLYRIVTKRKFDYFMVVLIVYQCGLMTLEKPHMDPTTTLYKIMKWSDYILFAIFALEALSKTVAFNFVQYIKRTNNQIDFLIVVITGVLIIFETFAKGATFLKGLRVLRAFKPLRILTRSAGMQLVMRSLILSVTSIGNVTVIMLMFFVIFSILGVQLFGGQFYSCNDASVGSKSECVGTFIDQGVEIARKWSNAEFNFDNLAAALQSLFITLTLDSYVPIVYNAMSVRGIEKQPHYASAKWNVLFFIAFSVIVGLCLLNLYVGVVFYQFSRIRLLSQTGSAFLTSDQQEWVEVVKIVSRMKPIEKVQDAKKRRDLKSYCIAIADSKHFNRLMSVIVGINILFMCLIWHGQPDAWSHGEKVSEFIFTGIFVIEALIKNIAFGPRLYFKQPMNRLDFFIVIASIASLLVDVLASTGLGILQKISQLFRVMRLTRMVRLIYRFKGMTTIVNCFIISLPALWNVGALLGLLFFIYAYMGVIFFGTVQRGLYINEHANFEDFGMALITLFRVATNDSWPGILVECAVHRPACPNGHCGSLVAYPFFYSFVLLGSIIMFNLFTAVVIENYEKQQTREGWRLEVSHLENFTELWGKFDDGTGTISPIHFQDILVQLPPPLGLGKNASGKDVLTFVADLDIPLMYGRVPFHRALLEIVQRVSGAEIPEGMLKQQIDKLYAKMSGPKAGGDEEHMNFSAFVTVLRIQKKWRSLMASRRIAHRLDIRYNHGADVLAPIAEMQRNQAAISAKLLEVFEANRVAREILEDERKKADREKAMASKAENGMGGREGSSRNSSGAGKVPTVLPWWHPGRWMSGAQDPVSKRNSSAVVVTEEKKEEEELQRPRVRVTPVIKSGITWKLAPNKAFTP